MTKPITDMEMAQILAKEVAAKGGSAYFVGGFVRDKLLGKIGKDMDIEVHGIETLELETIIDKISEKFSSKQSPSHICKGLSFGVYGIPGYDIDIAMPRTEKATGRGHRDFQIFVDPHLGIDKAARRRDFTINAMMEDVLSGELFDFYGGKEDLKKNIIRHVDRESFVEDPLRVLRAAQFAARFEFSLAEETKALCRSIDITTLSRERVFGELSKALLKSQKPSAFFEILRDLGQLGHWFSEIEALIGVEQPANYHPEGDVWNHTMQVLDFAAKFSIEENSNIENRLYFLLSALCHDLGKAETTAVIDGRIRAFGHEEKGVEVARVFLHRLTDEKDLIKYVSNMVKLHMKPNMLCGQSAGVRATNKMFDASIEPKALILLARCDRRRLPEDEEYEEYLWSRLKAYEETIAQPSVTGEDLINAGISPGEGFSDLMAFAHRQHLANVKKEEALKSVIAYAREKGLVSKLS